MAEVSLQSATLKLFLFSLFRAIDVATAVLLQLVEIVSASIDKKTSCQPINPVPPAEQEVLFFPGVLFSTTSSVMR